MIHFFQQNLPNIIKMSTRSGKRDTSTVYELLLFMDQEYQNDYVSMVASLSDTLQFHEPFPLLRFDKGKAMNKKCIFSGWIFSKMNVEISSSR